MYVRKFEADSLEEALSNIKRELGPDAIILKTTSNKGLKGAFKKNRIEITAAISEKNYTKKAKVDTILDENQKDKFYSNKASYISDMIDSNDNSPANRVNSKSGYGKVALNKTVNVLANQANQNRQEMPTSSLDHFLSDNDNQERKKINNSQSFDSFLDEEVDLDLDQYEEVTPVAPTAKSATKPAPAQSYIALDTQEDKSYRELDKVIDAQKTKIDLLEKKLFELTQSVEAISRPESRGITELLSILRSLDIEDRYIQRIVKKAHFELSNEEKEDSEVVFDFALKEMLTEVNVARPLFSVVDQGEKNTVTVLISESSCGQSTMLRKIASLQKGSVIVKNKNNGEFTDGVNFSEKFFNVETKLCNTISEIVAATRVGIDSKNNVFIDYKVTSVEINEVKKFIDGLKRSFENVEVLVCLSAINSEMYNRKVLNKYAKLAGGMVFTHLDQCLNFGTLFNLTIDFNTLPYKFFGTGEIVPDDLEAATAERILAGIFQL